MKKQNVLSVPYFSQTDSCISKEWQDKICGIVCVAMLVSYYDCDDVKIMDLVNEGVKIGGYTPFGWTHESLIRLIRNNGLHAYSEEFISVKVDLKKNNFKRSLFSSALEKSGVEKITYEIDKKRPVIASMHPYFRDNKESHLILIIGYEGNPRNPSGFYIHDPDNRISKETNEVFIDRQKFDMFWRKMAIFSRQLYQI